VVAAGPGWGSGALRTAGGATGSAGLTFGITRVSMSSSGGRGAGARVTGAGVRVTGAGSSQARKLLHRRQNWVPGGFCSPQVSQAAVVIVVGPPLA
jgi:hypothetical protein